ncbi:mitochondrial membrane protein [Coemansia helicoidea]|uniref:Mitochondrial membrane protein n=1 Tax=Coemansia helicoidea TaxID=1286919 RepID=A0ACC1L4T7_9FUNG|nr:mitochondrial membrane protein [Coemansia helicoidea]
MVDGYLPYAADAEQSLTADELLVLQRQYERELPRARVQTKFNYAWGLIKSAARNEQRAGVRLMHEIYDEHAERKRECMYYLAIGYYKMGEHRNARVYIEQLLALEPTNAQARSLHGLIDDKVARDGLIGLAVSGGVVALAGLAIAALFRKKST